MEWLRIIYYVLLLSLYAEISVAATLKLTGQGRGKGGSPSGHSTLASHDWNEALSESVPREPR